MYVKRMRSTREPMRTTAVPLLLLLLLLAALGQCARPLPADLDAWQVPAALDADGWLHTDDATAGIFEALYDAVHDGRHEVVEHLLAADAEYVTLGAPDAPVCRGRVAVRECLDRDAAQRHTQCAHVHCSGISHRLSVLGQQRVQVARVTEHYSGGTTSLRVVELYYVLVARSPTDDARTLVSRLERVRVTVPEAYTLPPPAQWVKT